MAMGGNDRISVGAKRAESHHLPAATAAASIAAGMGCRGGANCGDTAAPGGGAGAAMTRFFQGIVKVIKSVCRDGKLWAEILHILETCYKPQRKHNVRMQRFNEWSLFRSEKRK